MNIHLEEQLLMGGVLRDVNPGTWATTAARYVQELSPELDRCLQTLETRPGNVVEVRVLLR